jgi:hypothetical protein
LSPAHSARCFKVTIGGNGAVIDARFGAEVAALSLLAVLRVGVLRAVVAADIVAAFGLSAALRAGALRAAGAAFFVAVLIWRAGIEQFSEFASQRA